MLVDSVVRRGKKNQNLYDDDPNEYIGNTTLKSKKNFFSAHKTTLIFVSTIFVLFTLAYVITKSGNAKVPKHAIMGQVPVEEWNHQISKELFAQDVARSGIPVLLKNAPIQDWKALKWNPEYIKKRIQVLDRVAVQDVSNIFVYEERYRPMAGLKKVLRKSVKKWKNMLTEDFFSEAKNSKVHFYYTGKLEDRHGFYKISHDLDPSFFILPNPKDEKLKPQFTSINVWLGKNVITHAHYDPTANFYVQLYGKKKFILFPPEQYKNLYLHPFAHPKDRQSEVDFENPNKELFPLFGGARGIEVTIEKGDVLYIPPYWFHRVEAIDLSISVNVWSENKETIATPNLHMIGLPPSIDTVPHGPAKNIQRIKETVAYLRLLVREVTEGSDTKFINDALLENRYKALYNTLKCHDEFDHEKCPVNGSVDEDVLQEIRMHVQKISFEFDKLKKSHDGILDIILADYVEKVAGHMHGSWIYRC
eukprot:gene12283-5866_t